MSAVRDNNKKPRIIAELIVYFIFIFILWHFLTQVIKYRLYLHLSFYAGILASMFWWVLVLSVAFLLNKREKRGKNTPIMGKIWPLFLVWFCIGIIGFYAIDGWVGNDIGRELSVFIVFGYAFVPVLTGVIAFNYKRIKNIYNRSKKETTNTNEIK